MLHFLGEPFVEKNGERFPAPFKKAGAILFYLALSGRSPRERLKFLFWGDRDARQASGSMRNAIYLLRKALPDNFVVDRGYVSLNDFATDLDSLDELANPDKTIPAVIFSEPLEALDLPELTEFGEWRTVAANDIRNRIVEHLKTRVEVCYEKKRTQELADTLSALLVFEPFDEGTVLELMEVYRDMGYVAKAVSLYSTFREKMETELGLSPGDRAEGFLRKLVASAGGAVDARPERSFFCCREAEVGKIMDLTANNRSDTLLFFVHGEAGVGKSALVGHVVGLLSTPETEVFSARPLSIGEKYPYSSWNDVVSRMEKKLERHGLMPDPATISILSGVFYDFMKKEDVSRAVDIAFSSERNPVTIGRILADLTERLVGSRDRPVFVLEDLHWFDAQSLLLLKAFLSELRIPVTMFLTARPECVPILQELLYGLKTGVPHVTVRIPLLPFGVGDILHFCRLSLPEEVLARRGETYFIRESEGIPLLLVEMFRILRENRDADCSAGLRGVIMSRLEEMSPLQREILSVLSAFGGGASAEDLAATMDLSAGSLSDSLEELLRKKMVREVGEGGDRLSIDFSHANVRECIYDAIPGFRKKQLHGKIAEVLNRRWMPQVWNPGLSSVLRHHYTMAGQRIQVLKQHLQEMSFHIALNHVLFPMVRDEVLLTCSIPFSSREDTEERLGQVRGLLREIGGKDPETREIKRLEASYLEICSGYLVNWGEYREGLTLNDRALKIARDNGFDEIRLYCLEHVAHHFLQTDKSVRLHAVGQDIFRLAREMSRENHMGLALRFIGMAKLIDRDFKNAETLFRRSIALFEELSLTGRHYTLSLLAPRCYIGEMRQWAGDADTAMGHFRYCIRRCEEAGLFWGHSHFHAHAADVALDMGDRSLMCAHIDTGFELFESCRGGHCGSILYSLKAICDAERGRAEDALISLRKADFLSSIGKKTWRAAQYMAKAWVADMTENGRIDDAPFAGYLESPAASCAKAAAELYTEVGATKRADFVRKKFRVN